MSALPITATEPAATESRFRNDLDALEGRYVDLWQRTPDEPPSLGPPVSRRRQIANARAARRLIDRLAREVERYPDEDDESAHWRNELEAEVRAFGESRLGWPAGYRRLLFADAYYESSVAFSRRARAFDPDLGAEEIGQAIRNVWIMNSLQMLGERQVGLSPAIFAYSMLYPETDNYLDDPEVAIADKRRFNERLGRRLRGEPLAGRDRGPYGDVNIGHGTAAGHKSVLIDRFDADIQKIAFTDKIGHKTAFGPFVQVVGRTYLLQAPIA